MAQIIFQNLCTKNKRKGVKVQSAGTHTSCGLPQNNKGVQALIECGEKLGKTTITSTKFHHSMIEKFDYIVCMTYEHKLWIGEEYENVHAMEPDIEDPYAGTLDGYKKCCKQLQQELCKLYGRIFN